MLVEAAHQRLAVLDRIDQRLEALGHRGLGGRRAAVPAVVSGAGRPAVAVDGLRAR